VSDGSFARKGEILEIAVLRVKVIIELLVGA
jgi:hypothetical protein